MNKEEFKKYVLTEAQKYLFEKDKTQPSPLKTIKENHVVPSKIEEGTIDPIQIKKLAEEIKKINKTIDLRNPLISESEESLVESILNNAIPLKDRALVDDLNRKKHIAFQNEGEKTKWERMLKYNIPSDEDRP